MNRDDIREAIRGNLERKGLVADEIRVMPDPYSGMRIAVVSDGFEGMRRDERKQIVLDGLFDIEIAWIDLLTSAERPWAGPLPGDIEPDHLPLWPESLARAKTATDEAQFPSDLDEDLPLPIVATFYSLRGGVGRSTALAYTGRILAAEHGKKVVCVDLDLEAPGLAALFGKENEVRENHGVVDLLLALEQGVKPDASKHLIRVSDNDDLYCLPAGIPSADYARKLSLLDPATWYREDKNPLRELITLLGEDLPFKPDVILLDSRTGITHLSGPLLFDLADLAFIVFFPHPQTKTGTGALVRALLAARTRRSTPERPLAPEPRFVVSPIPATKVPEVVQRYKHRAAEWIDDWLSGEDGVVPARWTESAIKEVTEFIPYQEVLATSDSIFEDRDVWKTYRLLADWISKLIPMASEKRIPAKVADLKNDVLKELTFSTGTAEQQENILETFVETTHVRKALRPEIPLVIGRKGAGKTALFRRLAENRDANQPVVVLAPAKLRKDWHLTADGFKYIEERLIEKKLEWRELWSVYTAYSYFLQIPASSEFQELTAQSLGLPFHKDVTSESEFLNRLDAILSVPRCALLANDWLKKMDVMSAQRFLLFDGLDTGFGSAAAADRERRTRALEGLFTLYTDRGEGLKNLRFKILLREDIWKKLRFENKSHLFGRSVSLAWDKKHDYLRVVVRQALGSQNFAKLIDKSDAKRIVDGDTDEELVFRVWNILVGERMKGGNTTYTANWVWNRLADANDNRVPRALLQLFSAATEWEKNTHQRSPYEKTILRPRALMESLDTVSGESLSALMEEFPELTPLQEKLQSLGRSPLPAGALEGLDGEVALAREVGLLSIYEGTETEPSRYAVPDLYRIGLGMVRKGQL